MIMILNFFSEIPVWTKVLSVKSNVDSLNDFKQMGLEN